MIECESSAETEDIISKPDVSPIINICDTTFETQDELENVCNPISDSGRFQDEVEKNAI